jgi:glutamate racemase
MKIGVFDSGIGGITVLTELRRKFADADFVYLGDTAHVPYGTKSPAQIEKLSIACAKTLKAKNIDALVVACNTASSLALDVIQEVMGSTPVFGVVGPGIEAVLGAWQDKSQTKSKSNPPPSSRCIPILILATRATVQSQAYGKTLRSILDPAWSQSENDVSHGVPTTAVVIEQACPLLVPMIEEGWVDHTILHQTILEYIRPHLHLSESGIALLGCTHYPWIHQAFEKALPGWAVVNSALAVAESLERSSLFEKRRKNELSRGQVEWIFTDPDAVPSFAKKLILSGG